MRSKLPKDIEDELIATIMQIKPKEIWVFGSYGFGNPTKSSDIDIFVVKKKFKKNLHSKIVNLRNDLNKFSDKYNIEVDLFVDTRDNINQKLLIKDVFYTSVFSNAVQVYAKEEKEDTKPQMSKFEAFKILMLDLFRG